MMNKFTTEEFIEKAKLIHGDKYDYSKVEYIDIKTKVCIICPMHGEFWQTPDNHIRRKGCPICANGNRNNKTISNTVEFIKKTKLIHDNKYDYSKVEYINNHIKVLIICPIHGEFQQQPNNHLQGQGCPKCKINKLSISHKYDNNDFIKKAKLVHGDRYDYSKVEYIDIKTKVCIICPVHGEFWQTPDGHLQNKGCHYCNESKLEKNIRNLLDDNHIEFEYQKRFEWLGLQSLDFFLPQHNIAIECQGEQHFKPVDFANKGENWAKELFELNIKRDERKKKLCEENNIKIFYYPNIYGKENIIENIINHGKI